MSDHENPQEKIKRNLAKKVFQNDKNIIKLVISDITDENTS